MSKILLKMPTIDQTFSEIQQAAQRIRPFIRRTYLEPSPFYSQLSGANIFFKCENLQHTGSFKARGALNKLLSLSEAERAGGVVSASTGNHGAAVAFAAAQVGCSALIFVPQKAAASKLAAIERLGGQVRVHGVDSVEAERQARAYAAERGLAFVSPYNDPQVIGGQGTIGLELAEQLPEVDAVLASVGGGGLIAGIAAALKQARPGVRVVGCWPENSQVLLQSIKVGRILDLPSLPTLSDGTAGGVEAGSITFPLCRDLIDDHETVTEREIAEQMRQFTAAHHQLIEGSAAVPIAALLKRGHELAGKNVVVILCGANVDLETLRTVLEEK
jgi:threonine dehydratase